MWNKFFVLIFVVHLLNLKKSIIKTSTWFISHLQRVSEGDLVSAGAGAAAELDQSGGGGQLEAVSVLVPACR